MSRLSNGVLLAFILIFSLAGYLLSRDGYPFTYYKYADKEGNACYTDNAQSIPPEYQKNAMKVTEDRDNSYKKEKDDRIEADREESLAGRKTRELPPNRKKRDSGTGIINSNFFWAIAAIIAFLGLVTAVGKIGRSQGRQPVRSVIRVTLTVATVGILIFLYRAHVEKMADVFHGLKKDALDIIKRAEERHKKGEAPGKGMREPATVSEMGVSPISPPEHPPSR